MIQRLINISESDWDRAKVLGGELPFPTSRQQLLAQIIRSGLESLGRGDKYITHYFDEGEIEDIVGMALAYLQGEDVCDIPLWDKLRVYKGEIN